MSKTFTSRPGVSQTFRGRGRGQATNTRPVPVNRPDNKEGRSTTSRGGHIETSGQPSVRGTRAPVGGFGSGAEGARGRGRGATGRGRGIDRGMYGGTGRGMDSGMGRGMYGGMGRGMYGGTGRGMGRGMDPYGYQDDRGDNLESDGAQEGQSQEQRASHTGAYTVISPNEKKRRQITEQAEKGMRSYEEYKQQNKPTRVSYVGTVGGGQVLSMEEARLQQIRAQPTKTSRLMREQERKQAQKQAEERELEEKKTAARRKAELNDQRQKERQDSWKEDMRRKNQAFLDRLEAQGKAAAAQKQSSSQTSWPSSSQSRPPPHNPSPPGGGRNNVERGRGGGGRGDGASGGVRPKVTPPQYDYSLSRDVPQSSFSYSEDASGDEAEFGPVHDTQFYDNLELLQGMFPNYPPETLSSVLEQANGSVEDALHILGV